RDGAHLVLVFRKENGFAAAAGPGQRRLDRILRILDSGQIDLEGGSLAGFAVHPDAAAALLDDAIDGRESEPRPLARLFRGEEGLEDTRLGLGIHANPRIA